MARRALLVPLVLVVVLGAWSAMVMGVRGQRPQLVPAASAAASAAASGPDAAMPVASSPVVAPSAASVVAPSVGAAPPPATVVAPGGTAAAQARAQHLAELARALAARDGRAALTAASLAAAAPDVVVLAGDRPAAAAGQVSVLVTAEVLALAAADGTGGCWLLVERPGAPRAYGRGTACTGAAAVLASSPSW